MNYEYELPIDCKRVNKCILEFDFENFWKYEFLDSFSQLSKTKMTVTGWAKVKYTRPT